MSARWGVYLRLGRVSNLPTLWTNVLAGSVLAGAEFRGRTVLAVAAALSCAYTGGMYLNDAFDRVIDARERPARPIPSGEISASRVFAVGFGLLGLSVLGVAAAVPRPAPVAAAALLALFVVLYDVWHKRNPLSPVLMGLCRVLVYVTAALAVSDRLEPSVLLGAACLFAYLLGLTYVARYENKPTLGRLWPIAGLAAPLVYAPPRLAEPGVAVCFAAFALWTGRALWLLRGESPQRIPRAVTTLIAGISLLDALLLAVAGAGGALVAVAFTGWLLTSLLQRAVPGT
ncbi:UbiA family prenyltransferase [Myxococcaceae bacterium GXIMD 01537]